jgi:hypothetical protein
MQQQRKQQRDDADGGGQGELHMLMHRRLEGCVVAHGAASDKA